MSTRMELDQNEHVKLLKMERSKLHLDGWPEKGRVRFPFTEAENNERERIIRHKLRCWLVKEKAKDVKDETETVAMKKLKHAKHTQMA